MSTHISKDKLDIARARLITTVGHDVEWKTFAQWADLSPHTISGIRSGRSSGSPHTLIRIVTMLRDKGVPILSEELLEPELVPGT